MSPTTASIEGLPGADLIVQGIADVRAGKITVFSCLLWMAMPNLQRGGVVPLDCLTTPCLDPELTMYRLLRREEGDAFGRYKSLLRRLASFERIVRQRLKD